MICASRCVHDLLPCPFEGGRGSCRPHYTSHRSLDVLCATRRFPARRTCQTVFIPLAADGGKTSFTPETFNYQTRDSDDPKNLLLLCTAQGTSMQANECGSHRVFPHAVDQDGATSAACQTRTAMASGGGSSSRCDLNSSL